MICVKSWEKIKEHSLNLKLYTQVIGIANKIWYHWVDMLDGLMYVGFSQWTRVITIRIIVIIIIIIIMQ